MRKDLGELSDFAAVRNLVALEGKTFIDIGCGPGAVSREMVAAGATITGVEPDPIQAEKNRKAAPVAGLTFIESGAEKLPFESRSLDGVFFFRSLHHVPIELMDAALAEAARVVKPSGFLYVAEPGVDGSNFAVIKPFHDETHVRAEAQAALKRNGARLFGKVALCEYTQHPRFKNFQALVDRFASQTFNDIDLDKVDTQEVRALFETGRTEQGDYAFDQTMLVNLYGEPLSLSA
jgi:ubiquinone/menaquinone biosynthesis C-methylase UbiE